MTRKIKIWLLPLAVVTSLALVPASAMAQGSGPQPDTTNIVCRNLSDQLAAECRTGESGLLSALKTVVNVLKFVIGGAAVLMLIIGGIMYVFSGGDPQNTARAKDTILYAIVGLVIALLAQAIVSFVLDKI